MSAKGDCRVAVVVDDDDFVREMMCELLEMAGFKTIGCRDGTEGLRTVREVRPAVLTLDLHMPGMDGVEVLDRLAGDEATATVPVVVVSAHDWDRRVKSRRQVKAIVPKPFDVDDLCDKVRRAANDNDPAPRRSPMPGCDPEPRRSVVGGHEPGAQHSTISGQTSPF